MAHVREELRLGPACGLGHELCLDEFRFTPVRLRDICIDAGHVQRPARRVALAYVPAGLHPDPFFTRRAAHAVLGLVVGGLALQHAMQLFAQQRQVLGMHPRHQFRKRDACRLRVSAEAIGPALRKADPARAYVPIPQRQLRSLQREAQARAAARKFAIACLHLIEQGVDSLTHLADLVGAAHRHAVAVISVRGHRAHGVRDCDKRRRERSRQTRRREQRRHQCKQRERSHRGGVATYAQMLTPGPGPEPETPQEDGERKRGRRHCRERHCEHQFAPK